MKRIIGIATYAVMLSALATAATAKPPVAPVYEAAADINSAGWLTAPAENGRYYVAYTGTKGMTRRAGGGVRSAAGRGIHGGIRPGMVCGDRDQNPEGCARAPKTTSKAAVVASSAARAEQAPDQARLAPAHHRAAPRMHRPRAAPAPAASAAELRPRTVTERWAPPMVLQTVIVIQMGKGDDASFPGLKKAPEIFSAKTTAEEIRAKMKP